MSISSLTTPAIVIESAIRIGCGELMARARKDQFELFRKPITDRHKEEGPKIAACFLLALDVPIL
jgi:hypothetical protein